MFCVNSFANLSTVLCPLCTNKKWNKPLKLDSNQIHTNNFEPSNLIIVSSIQFWWFFYFSEPQSEIRKAEIHMKKDWFSEKSKLSSLFFLLQQCAQVGAKVRIIILLVHAWGEEWSSQIIFLSPLRWWLSQSSLVCILNVARHFHLLRAVRRSSSKIYSLSFYSKGSV